MQSRDGTAYWRVAIVEDHLLQRQGTKELIASQPGLRVVCCCESLPDFISWLETTDVSNRPHLLVLDLAVDRQPSVDPVVVRALVAAGFRVLVFSALTDPALVREVIRSGVGGIVGKRDSVEDILAALWTVMGRGEWMTSELAAVIVGDSQGPMLSIQEERALVLYASGLTLPAVAQALGVKPATAKTYLSRVKAKYVAVGRPARSKLDLSRLAVADGYLSQAGSTRTRSVAPERRETTNSRPPFG